MKLQEPEPPTQEERPPLPLGVALARCGEMLGDPVVEGSIRQALAAGREPQVLIHFKRGGNGKVGMHVCLRQRLPAANLMSVGGIEA